MSAVPLTSVAVEPTSEPSNPAPRAGRAPRVGAEPSRVARVVILSVVGLVFLVPLAAMFEFSLRTSGKPGIYSFAHYTAFFHPDAAAGVDYSPLVQGIQNSLLICLITVAIILVILLPTMLFVELRYPRLRRVLEFVCILPITIPTIVLVVGFVPVYQRVAAVFGSAPWTLAFAVGIIVLPYAFRPIAANISAFDLITLSEAARSLGANWPLVIWRVILPNMRRGVISSLFLTVAVVLGEYTIASFLSQTTFQTALLLISQQDPYVAMIFALASLLFAGILLVVIGRFGSIRPGDRERRRAARLARTTRSTA